MQENQNTNEQEQPKEEIAVEIQQNAGPATPQTSTPASPGLKEETVIAAMHPKTSNIEPQTETMEVHKHPHHVTHKKKWGEYLLEFLMIFFAVFLGFLAENIRERMEDYG